MGTALHLDEISYIMRTLDEGGGSVQTIYNQLPGALLPWYHECQRELPWRQDRDPYHIWLSEIMLQQTRVEAVKRYYARFLEALPTIEALANADDELLHKLWEGLGYYSRVRNLKKAAQVILPNIAAYSPGNMRRFWRCRESENTLPERSAPSPLDRKRQRWMGMCCALFPVLQTTIDPSTCRL